MQLSQLVIALLVTVTFIACDTHIYDHFQAHNHTHNHAYVSNATNYFGAYELEDKQYGTKTSVKLKGGFRIIKTNALPNHETGNFPNQGNPNSIKAQKISYRIPLNPVYTGIPKWVREPGVALNGVKFEPETAEVIVCDSGQNYRVEAKQNLIDLGLDFNNAHVQPTGAYHYHGTPTNLIDFFDSGDDLVHIGFAKDGFPIYYSKSNQFQTSYQLYTQERKGADCSYSNPKQGFDVSLEGSTPDGTFKSDWEYVAGLGDLDACNGIEINGKYMYLVTDTYPFVGRCLMGEFEAKEKRPPPPGSRRQNPSGNRHRRG